MDSDPEGIERGGPPDLSEDTVATPANGSSGGSAIDLAPGTRVAAYVIEEEIGRGGMGVVYRASEPALGRTVALKLMLPSLSSDPDFRARFESETRIAATLESRHVLPVFQAGEADGHLFMAMPYVEGGDLGACLSDERMKSIDEVELVLTQLAEVLDDAHRAGLVHRDVKPGNVLLEFQDGSISQVFLADFGLSKAYTETEDFTLTGDMIGSPEYMSPEQIAGDQVGPASDQYALACLAARMLYGFSPFKRENRASTLVAHLQDEPTWPVERTSVARAGVKRVLSRALAKDADKRFSSCLEFIESLEAELPRAGTLRLLRPRLPVTLKEARKRRQVRALVGALALLGFVGLGLRFTPLGELVFPVEAPQERILYWDAETKRITSMDLEGQDKTPVTRGQSPANTQIEVSPDGTRFVWWTPDGTDLHVMPTDGGDEVTLKGGTPKWSPDSRTLCHTSRGPDGKDHITCQGIGHLGRGQLIGFTPDSTVAMVREPGAGNGSGQMTRVWNIETNPPRLIREVNDYVVGAVTNDTMLTSRSVDNREKDMNPLVRELCFSDIRSTGAERCPAKGLRPTIDQAFGVVWATGPYIKDRGDGLIPDFPASLQIKPGPGHKDTIRYFDPSRRDVYRRLPPHSWRTKGSKYKTFPTPFPDRVLVRDSDMDPEIWFWYLRNIWSFDEYRFDDYAYEEPLFNADETDIFLVRSRKTSADSRVIRRMNMYSGQFYPMAEGREVNIFEVPE